MLMQRSRERRDSDAAAMDSRVRGNDVFVRRREKKENVR